MNNLDRQYLNLLEHILETGEEKTDRTGTGTLSIFGHQIRHDMSDGFPILTTKKVYWKGVVEELKWFLKGDVYAKTLSDKGVHIWDGDAKNNGRDDTYLGPIYGAQWRSWKSWGGHIDQIQNLINELKSNPHSRRHLVSAWNVGELDQMALPPCHYSFQCYVINGTLSLMWNQRSVDTFLGLPFNISSYGLLLLLLCKETGYEPGELIGNLGDTHLYLNHIDQAEKQLSRNSFKLPNISLNNVCILKGDFDVELLNYESHPSIKAPLSN
tara:strand:- start:189 stop:995 length:807 start_codon:yes stop_codon:yes gene_type:complete